MAFPEIRTSTPVGVVIIILALALTAFLLLFGVANLIHPDVPDAYLTENTLVCLAVCGLGVAALLVAIAVFRGILLKKRTSIGENQARG
jgi:membrane protein implicated in regulation of membrane protease activity